MRTPLLAVCLLLSAFAAAAVPDRAPRVRMAEGAVEGALPHDAPGAVFKGIPYAAAPEGALRWRPPAPAPVRSWHGVRAATAFAMPCVQNGCSGPAGSEDCLYLNVRRPEWPRGGVHPVMPWVHGGANTVGSASGATFDGAELARRGSLRRLRG